MNDFVEYYKEHNIVPSEQYEDYRVHLTKRRKLYRQLGVPVLTFRGSDILDIGPGDGYNTSVFLILALHMLIWSSRCGGDGIATSRFRHNQKNTMFIRV